MLRSLTMKTDGYPTSCPSDVLSSRYKEACEKFGKLKTWILTWWINFFLLLYKDIHLCNVKHDHTDHTKQINSVLLSFLL